MKIVHHIAVRIDDDHLRAIFLEAGVKLTVGAVLPGGGEISSFEIAEDDPRWQKVSQLSQQFRVIDLVKRSGGGEEQSVWLAAYSGQTVEELLSLEQQYRVDSLVLAFEQALNQKLTRLGEEQLSDAERVILAVEALEREINNGGYGQFFFNSSRVFAPVIVESLQRIGCPKTAGITEKAIKALAISSITAATVENAMALEDEVRDRKLVRCDESYYSAREPIAARLLSFIKVNRSAIEL